MLHYNSKLLAHRTVSDKSLFFQKPLVVECIRNRINKTYNMQLGQSVHAYLHAHKVKHLRSILAQLYSAFRNEYLCKKSHRGS